MALSGRDKRRLRASAHSLRPVVRAGAPGITQALIQEVDQALTVHELIKMRLPGNDRVARKREALQICASCDAELIQIIGHVAVLYRQTLTEHISA